MFESLWTWLVNMMHTVWYPGLLFATFLENFIPPIPSEVIMPLWWYLASQGKMNIILVILIGSLWSSLGTLPYFYIGKYFTKHKISEFVAQYGKYFRYDTEKLDNLYDIFNKNDSSRVSFGRFLQQRWNRLVNVFNKRSWCYLYQNQFWSSLKTFYQSSR